MKKLLKNFAVNFFAALVIVTIVASCTTTNTSNVTPNGTSTGETTPVANTGSQEAITIYTALEDDQIANYLPLFNKAHPEIKVNIVRDSTGVVTAKLIAEKDNPQADLVWGTAASSLLLADQEGILAPYAPKGLENVQERFRDSRNPPHWVGIDVWMSAFCVNTIESANKNLPIPTSWEDLINPIYQNQIVMSNPASSGTGFLSVSAILQMRGEEKGWEYLENLHKNIAQYMHSGSKPCKVAGTGEYAIGISFDYRAVKQKNDGEPIEPVFPKEGSGWDIEANALIEKPQIKEAAKTFLDWAITPEVSKEYSKSFAITAVKTDTPIPKGFPEDPLSQLIDNDFEWAAANRDRILKEWSSRFDGKSEAKS